MRIFPVAAGLAMLLPALAYAAGPIARDKLTDDGYWKIEATSRILNDHALAIDKAIYHAAELARAGGFRYVELHDPYGRKNAFEETATLYARGATAPVRPAACRSGKRNRCYTADVDAVIRHLSGDSGTEPGVAASSGKDQYGRTVYQSGFGTGAVGD